MVNNPNERVPITRGGKNRSVLAVPIALLAVAVMLGIGVAAFWSIPQMASVEPTTIGQTAR